MVWAAIGGAVATWGLNEYSKSQGGGGARQAAQMADPFAGQRSQAMSKLQGLMSGEIDPTKQAGYQFALQQGTTNLDRQIAAQGGYGSSGEKAALMEYGQGMASQQYNKMFDQYSQLAGMGAGNAATAGGIMGQQYGLEQQGMGQLGNLLGGAAVKGAGAAWDWLKPAPTKTSAQEVPAGGMASTGTVAPGSYSTADGSYWAAPKPGYQSLLPKYG
jgi:hypothetical protein